MHWDYKDQLCQTDLGGGGAAFYVYDASGQRARKVWEKAPGLTEERIYFGGFEIFRKHNGPIGAGTATLERETLHVMDDKQRIALVETRTLDAAGNDQAPRQLIRYQFGNHLGSASLELDEQGQIISYEEYAPYGSSTYQAVRSQTETAKRYRYTGKERDAESGLYYHGARYYAEWLGRWTSIDPAGLADGTNLYHYASCDPVQLADPDGTQPRSPVPVPGQTPFNFFSESPALPNWQRAVNEVLEPRFRGGSVEENLRRFEQRVQRLPPGSGRTPGTQSHYARSIFNQARSRFYMMEASNPSFSYSPTERTQLLRGRAPRPGFQLHHVEHIAQRPGQALRAGNLAFTQAGPSGGLTHGSGHHHLHHSLGARRLAQFQQSRTGGTSPAHPVTPPTTAPTQVTPTPTSPPAPRPMAPLQPSTRPLMVRPPGGSAPNSGSGGGGAAGNILLILLLPPIENFFDFVKGGLRLDPEARMRHADVLHITREDRAAAETARSHREFEAFVRQAAEQQGISEDEVRLRMEEGARRGPSYPTIGPVP